MKNFKFCLAAAALLVAQLNVNAQDNQGTDAHAQSNIQQYTPSKLIGKGQWDLKWFNNLYTQTESTFSEGKEPRESFFTSTLEAYTGVGTNKRWNVGAIVEFRSNVINDRSALDVFKFDGEEGSARSGLTSIAPSVKFVPIASVSNFSIQSSFFIPLVDNETENGVFLDQKGYTWQNRFFYDYSFTSGKWQLFSEINSELNFGDAADSFANNSLRLTPGVFLSYFPSAKFTVLALAQHSQLLDTGGTEFSQDFTALGGGVKYQLTKALNIEALYTNFVRGTDTGLGETFNIGLRGIF
ncbi:hypothetical protein [Flavobacterium sp. ASW18X]|uniref:hypothetical protein n=1 Tax=Flavobacterium sp. ASW18X TaxID=2572595 RepID=UPI0010AE6AF1|nr:hypothetical protein [Flavobacterium sp. ASW18X]TKD60988.1 hypothetical protein FBT53_12060 [Flavobacterium sp. ASW18X]